MTVACREQVVTACAPDRRLEWILGRLLCRPVAPHEWGYGFGSIGYPTQGRPADRRLG